MKREKVFRLFFAWDWEAEERWLNERSAQGWQFIKFTFPGFFTFEEGEPGAYQYRLQAMEHRFGSKESQDYLAFLRESGIELVDSYAFWAYLRKRSDGEQAFELFSDAQSKLRHLRRISAVMIPCLLLLCCNLSWVAQTLLKYGSFAGTILVFMEIALIILLLYGLTRLIVKQKELEKQKELHE